MGADVSPHPASGCVAGLSDRDGVQLTYGSSGLLITKRLDHGQARRRTSIHLAASVGGTSRYYLSAGDDRLSLAWTHVCRRRSAVPATRDFSAVLLSRSILHGRAHRAELIEQEVRAMAAWYGEGSDAEKCLLLECIGPPRREDLAFVLACRMRVNKTLLDGASRPFSWCMTRRSRDRPDPAHPGLPTRTRSLLTILLSGGHVWASDIEKWSTLRGWSEATVAAATSTRATQDDVLYTYVDDRQAAACGGGIARESPATRRLRLPRR